MNFRADKKFFQRLEQYGQQFFSLDNIKFNSYKEGNIAFFDYLKGKKLPQDETSPYKIFGETSFAKLEPKRDHQPRFYLVAFKCNTSNNRS